MLKLNQVFIIVIGLFITACAGSKPSKYISKEEANFKVRIERSPCLGKCPVYNLNVSSLSNSSSGEAILEAIRFVPNIGSITEAEIMPVEMDSLKNFLVSSNFFELDSVYDDPYLMDAPSTTITVFWGEQLEHQKEVVGRIKAPESFNVLVAYLERLRLRNF